VPAKRVVKFKVGRLMRERVCDDVAPAGRRGGQRSGSTDGRSGGGAPGARPSQPAAPKPPASPSSPF
jgi:hypothetical protein